MAYRSRTVSKQKKDKVRLPDYMTRTVVIWGLKDEEKQAAFVQGLFKNLFVLFLNLIKIYRLNFHSRANHQNHHYQA